MPLYVFLSEIKVVSLSRHNNPKYVYTYLKVRQDVPGASTGVPTHDKGHAERPDMQRRVRTRGPRTPDLPEHLPKTRICLFYYFTTFTNSPDIIRGLSLTTFL